MHIMESCTRINGCVRDTLNLGMVCVCVYVIFLYGPGLQGGQGRRGGASNIALFFAFVGVVAL